MNQIAISPTWPAPSHIKAYTTLRAAWGDTKQPKNIDSTDKLKVLLELPSHPAWIHQTHTATATHADLASTVETADASYTDKINQVCIVLTADCLPILICNKKGTHVAAIHAGWRGLSNGIIEQTLAKLNLPPEDLLVWLGPAIGPQKFEVGQDVYDAFTRNDPPAAEAFLPSSSPEKWLANLYLLATQRLNKKGVYLIFGGDYCTYTQQDLFFSYRKQQGNAGRMASAIWISEH